MKFAANGKLNREYLIRKSKNEMIETEEIFIFSTGGISKIDIALSCAKMRIWYKLSRN